MSNFETFILLEVWACAKSVTIIQDSIIRLNGAYKIE